MKAESVPASCHLPSFPHFVKFHTHSVNFGKTNKTHPTPRNALSVRWFVRSSRFLPPSNAHAHQSNMWAYALNFWNFLEEEEDDYDNEEEKDDNNDNEEEEDNNNDNDNNSDND